MSPAYPLHRNGRFTHKGALYLGDLVHSGKHGTVASCNVGIKYQ